MSDQQRDMHMSIDAQAYVRNAVQIANAQGDVNLVFNIQPKNPPTIARQIDPPVDHYKNFTDQLLALTDQLVPGTNQAGPRRVLVVGDLGSGKSELPRKFADEYGERYPGGHFSTRLIAETDVYRVLVGWLGYFGYTPDQLPASLEAVIGLWRTVTTGKAVLIVIDDALSADDVMALMPGKGPSAVIVVAIGTMDELENRYSTPRIKTTPLGKDQALALLSHRIGGDRIDREPEAADRLVELCDTSAAPLNVAARILYKDPYLAIADFVEQLERRGVLRRLSLSPIFEAAYDRLDDHSRMVYRALGAHPGLRIVVTKHAIGAAVPLDSDELDDAFDTLVDANLIGKVSANGYRLPPLVATHAADKAADQLPALAAAITAYYGSYGLRCAETLTPNRGWTEGEVEPLGNEGRRSGDQVALAWIFANEPAILAVAMAASDIGDHLTVVRLCLVTWPLYRYGAHPVRMIALNSLGLKAAEALPGSELYISLIRTQLGYGYRQQRKWVLSEQEFKTAMASGPLPAKATAGEGYGLLLREKCELGDGAEGDLTKARELLTTNLTRAKQILRRCELALEQDPDCAAAKHAVVVATRRVAMARFHLATMLEPEVAIGELLSVRGSFEREQANRIKIDLWLGRKLIELGNRSEAADVLNRAARDVETAEMRREQGLIWFALSDAEPDAAAAHLVKALRILEFGFEADAVGVRTRMAQLGLPV